jgi:hypothetical protein
MPTTLLTELLLTLDAAHVWPLELRSVGSGTAGQHDHRQEQAKLGKPGRRCRQGRVVHDMPDMTDSSRDVFPAAGMQQLESEPKPEPGTAPLWGAVPGDPSVAAGNTNQWRAQLGPLALERRSNGRMIGYERRSRRHRSPKLQLARYAVIAVALLVAVQFLGSQVKWLHLPHISFSSPVSPATTTITNVGPVILNHLEGIPNPAPAVANYSFNFQIRKTRRILWFWTVGFADTYYVSGEGYAQVLLNPSRTYWKQHPDAFDLTVVRKPVTAANGSVKPGDITLAVTLPQPSLPRSVSGVRLDPASGPVSGAAHWVGCAFHESCGASDLAQVYFTPEVEQMVAYEKLACVAGRARDLAATARREAYSTIYGWLDKFSQALHYNLTLSISWTLQGSDESQPLPKYCSSVAGSTVTAP